LIEVLEQIHAEDPDSPDPEELLTSAREALELAQKEDTLRQYRAGVRSGVDEP
jgi:hypothetical protein